MEPPYFDKDANLIFDFSHDEVVSLLAAQDIALAAGGSLAIAVEAFVKDPVWKTILLAAIGSVAATIAIHKAEFTIADKNSGMPPNGVEMVLPNWALLLQWYGALVMSPRPSAPQARALGSPPSLPASTVGLSWSSLGGFHIQPFPTVASNADGRQEIFVLGTDRKLYHNWETKLDGPWSGWAQLMGQDLHPPLVVVGAADHRLYALALGGDHHIYYRRQSMPNGNWEEWSGLPGLAVRKEFAAARNVDGRLEAVAVGTDGALHDTWQTTPNGSWSAWASLGGTNLRGEVALGVNADGRLEAFVIGGDGVVYHKWQLAPNGRQGWSEWSGMGDRSLPHIAEIGLVSRRNGSMVLLMMREDGSLSYRAQTAPNANFGAPVHLGGSQLRWPCAAGRHADGRLEVFVIGSDHVAYSIWEPDPNQPDKWSGWKNFPSAAHIQPGISVGTSVGQPRLFVVGEDGQVHSNLTGA